MLQKDACLPACLPVGSDSCHEIRLHKKLSRQTHGAVCRGAVVPGCMPPCWIRFLPWDSSTEEAFLGRFMEQFAERVVPQLHKEQPWWAPAWTREAGHEERWEWDEIHLSATTQGRSSMWWVWLPRWWQATECDAAAQSAAWQTCYSKQSQAELPEWASLPLLLAPHDIFATASRAKPQSPSSTASSPLSSPRRTDATPKPSMPVPRWATWDENPNLVASGKSCAYAVEETLSAPLGHKRTGRADAPPHLPSHNLFFLFFPVPTSLLWSFSSNAVITILLLPLRPRLLLHELSANSSDITKP